MDIVEIKDKNKIFAIVFRHSTRAKGARFLTPASYPLQIGLLEHPAGTRVRPHRHPNIKYNVSTTQEFLYIEKGTVEAMVYRNDWSLLKRVILKKGDCILSVRGGHSFRMLTPSRIIEIKQGPYPGDAKAKIFKPV